MRLSRVAEALAARNLELHGKRVALRPLVNSDYDDWRQVRIDSHEWLTKWEPKHLVGAPDPAWDRQAFESRNSARNREWQIGAGYGFGIFVDQRFVGEINMANVLRGPFQSASIGYWISHTAAGRGYVPEAVVVLLALSFEELGLHRIQIPIVPRNAASRRVVEKLNLRNEGTALRYLEINGVWEDHIRYAMTVEEWLNRGEDLKTSWIP